MTFLFVYQPVRSDFHPERLTPQEASAIQEHFDFLKGHHEAGALYMAGRREDGEYGFAIIEAGSLTEALAKADEDPAVQKGVFRAEVHPFNLALY